MRLMKTVCAIQVLEVIHLLMVNMSLLHCIIYYSFNDREIVTLKVLYIRIESYLGQSHLSCEYIAQEPMLDCPFARDVLCRRLFIQSQMAQRGRVYEVIWTLSIYIQNPTLREANTANSSHRFQVRLDHYRLC